MSFFLGEYSFRFSFWAVPYLGMAFITGWIAVVAWSRRNRQGALGLCFDQLSLMVTALVLVLMLTATDAAMKAFLWKLMFLPLFFAGIAWTHMALSYSDSKHFINRFTTVFSFGFAIVLSVLMFVPDTTRFFLSDWQMTAGTLQIEVGFLFWILIFGWVTPHFGTGAIQLGRLFYKGSGFGPQLMLLISGIAIVFVAHLLYPLQLVPIEIGPLGSFVKTLFFLAAIFWFGMFDVAPVAREKLVENMDDPVLAINENNRVADINPAGEQLIAKDEIRNVTGRTLEEIVGERGEVLLEYIQSAEGNEMRSNDGEVELLQKEIAIPVDDEPRHYDLAISPLTSRGGEIRGKLIVLRDISELKQRERQLKEEQERSRELLLNILPEKIVTQWDDTDHYVADTFQEATVLFADIVNFTSIAHELSAEEVVKLLDEIFSRFDRIVDKKGLEKIKTIGDEYFVASGVPETRENHAEVAAELALELRDEISNFHHGERESLDLRIGLHSGPLVGGIIGEEKFVYDVWGDTVNLGSRMESQGVPGKIQLTPATKKAIEEQSVGQFEFNKRGEIEVKGSGTMTTYFLTN